MALTLFPLRHRGPLPESGPEEHHSLAVRGLVDGLIITTLPDNHPIISNVIDRRIPFVVVDSPKIKTANFETGCARAVRPLFNSTDAVIWDERLISSGNFRFGDRARMNCARHAIVSGVASASATSQRGSTASAARFQPSPGKCAHGSRSPRRCHRPSFPPTESPKPLRCGSTSSRRYAFPSGSP
jgi:hypothetical protein